MPANQSLKAFYSHKLNNAPALPPIGLWTSMLLVWQIVTAVPTDY
jgi:hypothetical protein